MKEFPCYIFIDDSSLTFSSEDNIVRSQSESGQQKTKKRNSLPIEIIKFNASINKNNYRSFQNWKNENENEFFILNHPLDGTKIKARLRKSEFEWAKNGTLLLATFELEYYAI